MKKSKKIGIIMIILLLLSSYLTPLINVANAYSVNNAYIYSVQDPEYHLQYWNNDRQVWSYLITSYVGYTGEDGKFYPAYCLNADRHGVGDEEPYTVTVTEAIQNPEVWRVLYNGFPYKTAKEMNVANDYDAFCATKQAIYSVLYGYDPVARYRGGDERGTLIANAIVKMVNIARTTSDNYASPQISINEIGSLKKEGSYYTQTYSVSSNVPVRDYKVYQISGLPSGSYFADAKGAKRVNFTSGEKFKVYIPQKSIVSNVTAKIGVESSCKTYPVLYGKAPNTSLQDYALVLDVFENGSANKELKIHPTGQVTIQKTSTADNIWNGAVSGSLIQNAKYNLYNSNKKLIGTYTTNKEGKIQISGLSLGTYYIQETNPVPQYTNLNNKIYSFTLDYIDESETLKVTNIPVLGGYFSAVKISKRDNIWTGVKKDQAVAGAKYGIYDLNGKIVKSYTTGKDLIATSNENGVIFNNEKLQLGEYYLQEIEAPAHSIKDNTKYYFKVTENGGHVSITASDDVEIGNYVKITKVSADKNYITGTEKGQAVEGAKYEVRTGFADGTKVTADNLSTGKLIDTLVTDKEGNTKTIIVGKGTYYIKEVSVPEGWQLDEKIYKVDVISNGVTHTLKLKDKPISQGFLNIDKTALQKNCWTGEEAGTPLEGVKFELRDEKNNVLLELVTDKNGKFSKDVQLDVGKYYLWEVEAPEYYILNDKPNVFEIKENGQKIHLDIKNKPAEIKINVEKSGVEQAKPNEEIRYDFDAVESLSNVPLDNFTFIDYLPYEKVNLTKLFTGIYSHKVKFNVYYKTTLLDKWTLIKENLDSTINNFIDFSKVELAPNEVITNFKMEFGTVPKYFKATTTPHIFTTVKADVKGDDLWTNYVNLSGTYLDVDVKDESEWTTKTPKEKEPEIKKLPKTGE